MCVSGDVNEICVCSLVSGHSTHDGSGVLRGQRVSLQHGSGRREDDDFEYEVRL